MPKHAHTGNEIDFTVVPADAGVFELTQDTGVGARWRLDFWCMRLVAVLGDSTNGKSSGFEEAMSRLQGRRGEPRPTADGAIALR
jgi:hypothetical protein